ncbi:MAG: NYN domain-containing protein [Bacteroidetes bacterium]|nr:MAG: NYN domain-containing protein [Bacteroidota bacterium]
MAKVMVFIDGSWLYASVRNLADDFHIDYGKLPKVLCEKVAEKIGARDVDLVRTFLFGSNARNYQDADKEMVRKRRIFYDTLREEYNYEVEVYEIDYHGRRLRKQDRDPDDDFIPIEKCVDIALASSMLYYAALPNAYDIAVVVGGDRDLVPVLQRVRLLGKRVAIASIKGACSVELKDYKDRKGIRDFDVIWLNDCMEEIQMIQREREVECKSPFHEGPNPVLTDEFVRKSRPYFCRECREKMWSDEGGLRSMWEEEEEVNGNLPEVPQNWNSGNIQEGDLCRGVIKRKLDYCGFIETLDGDFYFGAQDCAPDTEFHRLQKGMLVEFVATKLPNKELRGGQGNGNAEEVSLVTLD